MSERSKKGLSVYNAHRMAEEAAELQKEAGLIRQAGHEAVKNAPLDQVLDDIEAIMEPKTQAFVDHYIQSNGQ